MRRKKQTRTLTEITRRCPDDPDDAMVPCAGASSDELQLRHRASPPSRAVTLIRSNTNRPQGPPAFSSPRALSASPLLRYLLYPASSSDLHHAQRQSSSYSVQALVPARRGAPMSHFIPSSHRRSRAAAPIHARKGEVCPGLDTTVGRREFRRLIVQIPSSMTIMPYSISSHPRSVLPALKRRV